jgi:serine/threonine-protein kinase
MARLLLQPESMTSAPSPARPDGEGHVIAQKYRLERLLGEGGMGSVWRAFNLHLDVPVAIKLLRADLSSSELNERLRVEARASAKLVHPAIVRVFDIGEAESGDPFIVMELLQGESLGAMLQRGPLSALNTLQLMLPIAEALSLAHSRGVVHRDLKPDNIFITRDGSAVQPKLLDFGIAKVTSAIAAGGPTLTQTGTLLGSPEYMSPEQAYGRGDIDERSDVWAFCVVLYELLAGQPPFRGSTCQAILQSVIQDEAPALELLGIDPLLSGIISRGFVKDRDARLASIFELGRELAAWLAAQGITEDSTGSSLEAKWLGRSTETLGAPPSLAPRAQHEHATLVSVVNPAPRIISDPVIDLPLRRVRRWVPTAAVVATAALACLAWASFSEFRRPSEGASLLPPSVQAAASPTSAAELPVRAEAAPPLADIAALPVEPAPPAPPKRFPVPTRNAVLHSAPAAPASALPRALPAHGAHGADLLNPY